MNKGLGTFLTGVVAFSTGMIAGLLLAPKSGKESRKWLSEHTDEAKNWIDDKAHKLVEESEKTLDKMSEGIKKTVHDALPDLYEATEMLNFEEEDIEENG